MSMGGGVHVLGGAVAVLTRVTVTRCSGGNDKTGNHNRGGGIYVEDIATVVTLTNITISHNSLDISGKGGGLNVDSGARVNATDIVVSGNSAFFAAGIFIGKDCSTNIDRAMITGNRADYGGGVGVFGGASPTITNSLIAANIASKWGGGLLVYTGAKASLQRVSFEKNAAELGGGAVAYTESSFTVIASKFVSNVASIYGGAIHLQTLSVVGLVYTRLEANMAATGGGGAHVTSGASLSMTGGTVKGNNASQSGGGILCHGGTYGGGNLSMTAGTTVISNTCGTLGGGLHMTGGCFVRFTDGVAFRGNVAGQAASASDSQCHKQGNAGGGAVAVEPHAASGRATTLITSGCAFTHNVAPDGGGVIITDKCEGGGADCQRNGAKVHLASTIVSGNKAIGCQDPATTGTSITASFVAAGTAVSDSSSAGGGCASYEGLRRGSGGGIFAASGVVSIVAGTTVEDNVATASGGGVQCQGSASLAMSGNSTRVDDNVAGDTGGGIMHSGRHLRVTGGASFRRNRATDGGAVAIILSSSTSTAVTAAGSDPTIGFEIVDNVTLTHNLATRRGGAFYVSASMARGNLSGIVLRNSTAAAGPGFYWIRAASPAVYLECRDCSLWDGGSSNNVNTTVNMTTGAAVSSPIVSPASDLYGNHYESRATEALSLSFDVALPLELQSGVTVPLFTVTLVDYYGRVASTEDDVPCRLEEVTSIAATPSTATSNATAGHDTVLSDVGGEGVLGGAALGTALEVSGILSVKSSAGIASFDQVIVRGRLGGGYTARVKCHRGGEAAGEDTTSSISRVNTTDDSDTTLRSTTTVAADSSNSTSSSSSSSSDSSTTADVGVIDEMIFPLKIALCSPGQEPLVAYVNSEGVSIAKECAACKDRTFNFDGVACKSCPLGGECLGGDRLESRAGWWRSADRSEVLFACPFAAACRAGNTTAEAACATGYRGPVCGICETGYRRWGSACVACGETSTFVLPLLGMLGFTAFIVYIFVVPANDSANKACLFSSLIFIAQCLGLLKDYDVTLPSGIDRVIDTLNLANLNLAALAPGCSDSDVNFYRNYLTGIAVPPTIIIICSAVYAYAELSRSRSLAALTNMVVVDEFTTDSTTTTDSKENNNNEKKKKGGRHHASKCEDLKRRCVRNAVWLMVLAYSGVAKTALQLYNARHLDVGSFLRRDYSIDAADDTYRMYAATGYIALLLYPIGIPLVIAWVLRSAARGNKLDDPNFTAKFGFLYGMYRPRYVAWELTGLLTKFVLAAIPVFATERNLRHGAGGASEQDYGAGGGFAAACQASLAQAACLVLLIAVMWLKPHRSKLHSTQQATAAAVVLGWTLVVGGVLNSPLPAPASSERSGDTDSSASASTTKSPSVSPTSDPGEDSAGFTAEERVAVCFAAAAATAVAALTMITWSAVAGELDDFTARRASDTIQNIYRRVSMYIVTKRFEGKGGGVKKLLQRDDDDDEYDGQQYDQEAPTAINDKHKMDESYPMSPPRGDYRAGETYSYDDQLRSLVSSPPHHIVECAVRPEDDLLKDKDGVNIKSHD